MDFWISKWISGFQIGFLDFRVDFWISLDFWISDWISADSVRDFFRGGPLGALRPVNFRRFSRLKTVYSAGNGAPKEAEEPYLRPFVSKRREMAKPVPTKAFLQPAKAAAMCTRTAVA